VAVNVPVQLLIWLSLFQYSIARCLIACISLGSFHSAVSELNRFAVTVVIGSCP